MRLSAALATLAVFAACAQASQADTTLNWSQELPAQSPGARESSAMAYDAENREMVLFGGLTQEGVRLDDTWTWDGEDWNELSPANSPSPRSGAKMAFDPVTNQLILVGGTTYEGASSETWTWDGSDWTELSPSTPAPALFVPSIATDRASGNVILFGGSSGGSGTMRNWTWAWNGSNWTELSPASSPPARFGAPMAYDPVSEEVVLFSGGTMDSAFRDTWTWDGSTWTERFPSTSPPFGAAGSMAFSPETESLIHLNPGGLAVPGAKASTWSWDGSDWSQLTPETDPSARFSNAMQLDEASGKLLVFGGLDFFEGALGDTWTFGIAPEQPEEPDPEDPDPEPVCQEVEGGLSLRAFKLAPPLGGSPSTPGLRIRLGARGDVDAKISPRLTYSTRNGPKTFKFKPRTIRVNRSSRLRFKLPQKVKAQLRRRSGSVEGKRLGFRLQAKLKPRGDGASCFRSVPSRTIKVRVTNVSSRVAVKRR